MVIVHARLPRNPIDIDTQLYRC